MADLRHREAVLVDLRLHYVEAGNGPLVVLLHGFPECWYCWRHQIGPLADAGFRVLAPDLRGYNESDKPRGVRNYRLSLLTQDVVALIRHAGSERATVIGHDWGGVIAWAVAMRHPETVERLGILNAPHPLAFRRELSNPVQLFRSWYVVFFQLPWLPEQLIRAGDFAVLERVLRDDPTRREAFTKEDIQYYKQALRKPGALTAMVNYYRALFRYPGEISWPGPVQAPTLVIWGERDRYLSGNLSHGLHRWAPWLRVERIADCSHWTPADAPAQVNDLLLSWLLRPA